MEKAFYDPVDPSPARPPRFSLGRRVGWGLVACLWLWSSADTLSAVTPPAKPASYPKALESFNRRKYDRALDLLDGLPTQLSGSDRADALNLRGAIYLRQNRFDEAQAAFAAAAALDPKLWAARFNQAEVLFRQKHYAASREHFDALKDNTSGIFHPEERRFLDYKVRLADLCAGRDKGAVDYIAEHRDDSRPPLAWYYLNAALERRRDHPQKAEQWLAQADAKRADGNARPYAKSFEELEGAGTTGSASGRELLTAERRARRQADPASPEIAQRESSKAPATRDLGPAGPPVRPSTPATVAVVQLLSERPTAGPVGVKPVSIDATAAAFRFDAPPAPVAHPAAGEIPPTATGMLPSTADASVDASGQSGALSPNVLAKPPRRGRSTPTPAPSATPTPIPEPSPTETPAGNSAGTGASAPTPSASVSPTVTPSASVAPSPSVTPTPEPSATLAASTEYTQKYEAAYVKFLEKDYSAALTLLAEAEVAQPKQAQSVTLRAQIFKQEYEAAYLAYRKGDYPLALSFLDGADAAQPNYPDALNLRGLVFSKQRSYDRAEGMFKKAVGIDPTLWAAKFNYAELPFNRGDYTTARTRFEDLLAETDAAKRPREAELTQYKVFLTLLMEGKADQARSFMDHFNFSGATPAKYFCNAAMNFRAGTVDKANGWIDSARREYPAQLVSIFVESFYRLGWMTDPNAMPAGTALAAASPAVEAAAPSVAPSPSASPTTAPPVVAVIGKPTPPLAAASPILVASSSPTAIVALSSTPTPPPFPKASPSPTASPVVAAVSVTPIPSPKPVATPSPSPTATPAPTATAKPSPTPTSKPTATPQPSPTATPKPSPSATATPTESPAEAKGEKDSPTNDFLRLGIPLAVLVYGLYVGNRIVTALDRRKKRRRRAARLAATSEDKQGAPSEES